MESGVTGLLEKLWTICERPRPEMDWTERTEHAVSEFRLPVFGVNQNLNILRLFHAPFDTKSSGCLMVQNEVIWDVKQTITS